MRSSGRATPPVRGTPLDSQVFGVDGFGSTTSNPFVANVAGTYRYVVSYSGDTNDAPAFSGCNAANETVVVGRAVPTLMTAVSAGAIPIGGTVNDVATLAGGFGVLQGTIDFTAYGPNDATCSGTPAFTSTGNGVDGPGTYTSANFTPGTAGTYRFIAAYSGDANNAAVTTACNDANETVVVSQAAPTLVTQASTSVLVGGPISDTATLAGGVNPTGTITFTVFGPNDATCANTPAFSSTNNVIGNGNVTSDPFTTTQSGTYRFIAAYSGDANNAAVTTACNDANESVLVVAQPTLTTSNAGSVALGQPITDTATLAGGSNPTGTLTFNVYGPNDSACAGSPVSSSNVNVTGNADYPSAPYSPRAPGTYRWTVTYSGDANNATTAVNCGEPFVVASNSPTLTTQASPGVTIGGTISDVATLGRDLPGHRFDHLHRLWARRRDLRQPSRLHVDAGGDRRQRHLPLRSVHAGHRRHLPVGGELHQRRQLQHLRRHRLRRPQ